MMELGNVGFWGTIFIGILAGWLAHKVMGGRGGIIWNLIIGLVGSWIGFFVSNQLKLPLGEISSHWFWGNLIVSAAGAIVLLFLLRLLRGR